MASKDDLLKKLAELQDKNQQLRHELNTLSNSIPYYAPLIESAADAIFVGNPNGHIIFANPSATLLSGYSHSELLTMNLRELFSEEENQRAPLRYDLLKQGKTVKNERDLTRKDGTLVPVEMSSRLMPDGTYHSFFRNITERKQADEDLRISEHKFSQIFHLNPDAISLTKMVDGQYIDVNQAYCNISGWSRQDLIGSCSISEKINIWHHHSDRVQMVKTLQKEGEVLGFEAKFVGKNKDIIIGLLSARIIEINGEPCILTLTKDITHWKKLLTKQQKLEEQMLQVQKLESLGVLAGGIAHDFNNILMAVIGHCELAQRRLTTESPAMEHLRQINLAAERAADLANQMLAYSGKGKFVIEAVDFSQIVRKMEHILSVSISKKATLRYDLAKNLPSIEADATQLRQITMNLVINASEAIGDNNGVIAVSTGVMECDRTYLQETWLDEDLKPGAYVYLEVADTGCGIEPVAVKRIFEPFFSTKFTGRGLGMAAVLGIVRGHHGAIKVYTEPGSGSTFKVLFPASSLPAVRQQPDVEAIPPLNGSGLVLLVDDEATVRNIGTEMLADFGFETITACDGREALDLFQQRHHEIKFVLMDLTMPRMGGEEAFREFRRIDPDVKVIICSGYNEQEVSQKFVGKGLAGFLKKPYLLDSLQKMIQKITESS